MDDETEAEIPQINDQDETTKSVTTHENRRSQKRQQKSSPHLVDSQKPAKITVPKRKTTRKAKTKIKKSKS